MNRKVKKKANSKNIAFYNKLYFIYGISIRFKKNIFDLIYKILNIITMLF